MPQAPDDLRARWGSDSAALDHLGNRYLIGRSGVIQPLVGTAPTEEDYSAINYLIMEWDYGYNEIAVTPRPQTTGRYLVDDPGQAAPGAERTRTMAHEGPSTGSFAFDPTSWPEPVKPARGLGFWNKFSVLFAGVALAIVGHSMDFPDLLWAGVFLGVAGLGLFVFVPNKQ